MRAKIRLSGRIHVGRLARLHCAHGERSVPGRGRRSLVGRARPEVGSRGRVSRCDVRGGAPFRRRDERFELARPSAPALNAVLVDRRLEALPRAPSSARRARASSSPSSSIVVVCRDASAPARSARWHRRRGLRRLSRRRSARQTASPGRRATRAARAASACCVPSVRGSSVPGHTAAARIF